MELNQLIHFTPAVAKEVLETARTNSRKAENIKAFIGENAINHLLSYIFMPPPPHLMNLALSVVANLLIDDDGKRQINREQILTLLRMLDETTADEEFESGQDVQVEVKGRLIRALSNIAQGSSVNRDIMIEYGVFKSIGAAILCEENPELYEVACRALRVIPSNEGQRRKACISCAQIPAKALLMDRKVARSAVRAVSNLSKTINPHLTSSLLHYDGKPLKILLKAITSRTITTRQDALSAILRLTQRVGALRPKICTYGGLILFKANLEKTGGGFTRHGIPFLRSVCCCIREAVNRKKIRESGFMTVFATILRRPLSSETKPLIEADELVLMAKAIILTSLTGFYYDDEGINDMITLEYASIIASLLPETLIEISESPDAPTDYDHNIAASSDLPTAFNKVDLVPPISVPQNSFQTMKRLQSSSSSDESFESGLSPSSSPVRRQFKRRRRNNRSTSSSSDECVGTPGVPSKLSVIGIQEEGSGDPKSSDDSQRDNRLTQEEAAIMIINRFMTVKPDETIEQLAEPKVLEALLSYIGKGGQLNWIIQKMMETIISRGSFTNLLLGNFMSLLAKSIEDRYLLNLPEDKKDDLLVNISAKWIDAFVCCASSVHSFTVEAWLTVGEDQQQLAVARTVPFILSDESNWLHVSESFEILRENIDEHCFRAVLAFSTEVLKKLPRFRNISNSCTAKDNCENFVDSPTVTVILSDDSIRVTREKLESVSPMFKAMLAHAASSDFIERSDQIQLPTFESNVVNFVFGLSDEKPKDPLSVDLFCQQYLVEGNIRQNLQRKLLGLMKAEMMDSEAIILHISDNINSEQLLPWPVEVMSYLCDYSNRSVFRRVFYTHSDNVFNILSYLLSVSSSTSSNSV